MAKVRIHYPYYVYSSLIIFMQAKAKKAKREIIFLTYSFLSVRLRLHAEHHNGKDQTIYLNADIIYQKTSIN